MAALPIVLLPGMDGTGDLFDALVESAPPPFSTIVVRLPAIASYEELLEAIRPQLPQNERFAVVGESFSGPLALRVARDYGKRVTAVILCNSFITPPRAALLRVLPWSLLFLVAPPKWVIRHLFLGSAATPMNVAAVQTAIKKTPRKVLAARIRAICDLDDVKILAETDVPMLYLRGTADVLVPARVADHLQQIRQRVVVQNIAAPHLLFQTAPDCAWRAITAFVLQGDKFEAGAIA